MRRIATVKNLAACNVTRSAVEAFLSLLVEGGLTEDDVNFAVSAWDDHVVVRAAGLFARSISVRGMGLKEKEARANRLRDAGHANLALPISEFDVTVRTLRLFNRLSIDFIWEVAEKPSEFWVAQKGFGPTIRAGIVEALAELGLQTGMSIPDL